MNSQVKVKQGLLRGSIEKLSNGESFLSFKGIPYAQPPVGPLRFKPPQPPSNWTGLRDATKHGDVCIQNDVILGRTMGGEDCLYLNVYTPAKKTEKLPVMVFVHGGGYQFGSGDTELYGPKYLVRKNVVLVTINYRLGVLGFLCLHNADVPGNAGLKDQAAALKWVKENIDSFGGDSDNVTLFGESAGGASSTFHLFSPLSAGLFHRVIAQSGACTKGRIYGEDHIAKGFNLGKYLGKDTKDLKELVEFLMNVPAIDFLNIPVDKIVDTSRAYMDPIKEELKIGFLPVVEKYNEPGVSFLTESVEDLLDSGNFYDVPLILGCNNGEGILMLNESFKRVDEINNDFARFVPVGLRAKLSPNETKVLAKRVKEFYFGDKAFSEETKENLIHLRSDILYCLPITQFAKMIAAKFKSPVYFYVLSFYSHLNYNGRLFGAGELTLTSHTDDLYYLFTSDYTKEEVDFTTVAGKMIETITTLWTNVAKHGNPTPDSDKSLNVKWKPMSVKEFTYLSIGEIMETKENPFKERMDFWKDVYKN